MLGWIGVIAWDNSSGQNRVPDLFFFQAFQESIKLRFKEQGPFAHFDGFDLSLAYQLVEPRPGDAEYTKGVFYRMRFI